MYPPCTLRSGWTFNPSAEPSAISGLRRRARPPGPRGQCPWTMEGRGQPRHLSNRLNSLRGGAGSAARGPGIPFEKLHILCAFQHQVRGGLASRTLRKLDELSKLRTQRPAGRHLMRPRRRLSRGMTSGKPELRQKVRHGLDAVHGFDAAEFDPSCPRQLAIVSENPWRRFECRKADVRFEVIFALAYSQAAPGVRVDNGIGFSPKRGTNWGQCCGRFTSSGSLTMLAAMRRSL